VLEIYILLLPLTSVVHPFSPPERIVVASATLLSVKLSEASVKVPSLNHTFLCYSSPSDLCLFPGWAEAVVHAVNCTQDNPLIPPNDKWTLLIDFSLTLSTQLIVQSCLGKYVTDSQLESSAATAAAHCFIWEIILLRVVFGLQQGDRLAPLCFPLVLQLLLERIAKQVTSLIINCWYLEDGTLCGNPQDLSQALSIIEEYGPLNGLHINREKSLLYIPRCLSNQQSPPL
jgi:hypothetical protein